MITKLYNKKSNLININILILFKINYVPYRNTYVFEFRNLL